MNAFAKRCEVPEATMRNYFKGRFPSADVALQLSDAAGVNFEWLVGNRGPMRLQTQQVRELSPTASGATGDQSLVTSGNLTIVPRLEVEASAGPGILSQPEDAFDFVGFSPSWLRSIGVTPAFARIISARGDSMESTIRDGDLLLVDTSISEIRDNGIYCVVFGNMLLVKRVHARMNGSVQLISDNPHYPPEEVTAGEVDQINVAGRVMWFGRTM